MGITSAIITLNTNSGDGYGTFIVQGYGNSDIRLHAVALQSGNSIEYQISSNEEKITFNLQNLGTRWECGIIMLYGNLPVIS